MILPPGQFWEEKFITAISRLVLLICITLWAVIFYISN